MNREWTGNLKFNGEVGIIKPYYNIHWKQALSTIYLFSLIKWNYIIVLKSDYSWTGYLIPFCILMYFQTSFSIAMLRELRIFLLKLFTF